jgi:hypothetical protein
MNVRFIEAQVGVREKKLHRGGFKRLGSKGLLLY